MQLNEKVVIVTGASKGLGVSMAKVCAAEGARVIMAARSLDLLEKVGHDIKQTGGNALSVRCDVSQMGDLNALVDGVISEYGRIDGLINNAGVNFVKSFLETTEAEWDHIIDVDLKGSFFLTQLCAKRMVSQTPRGGSIVQVASVHTLASVHGAGPYDAAKRGMVGYSKAAAIELAPFGVRINVVSPGLCRTEIWNELIAAAPSEEACYQFWNANIPAERLIEPEEIADVCVYLLGDHSTSVTGANIVADCGMTSQLVSREPYESKTIEGR